MSKEQRNERRAVKRARLLDTARQLHAERGFKGFTIADLAATAAMSVGSVYLYFESDLQIYAELMRADLRATDTGFGVSDLDRLRVIKSYLPGPLLATLVASEDRGAA